MEPWQLGAAEAVACLRSGKLGAVELVASLLARIDHLDPALHAWVTVDRERALARAAAVDAQPAAERGPLAGLPVGLKDVVLTAGLRTTASSRALAGHVPDVDATVVTRLKQADGVVLGKLETCEFACGDPSVVANPWDAERTPGGSSSGSAVAVAVGMVPASLGTQTGGSTLRPAAYNGVVGFMPTAGAVSNRHVIPLAWSLDHIGFYGRTVADIGVLLAPLRGYDSADPASQPRPRDVPSRTSGTPPVVGLVRSGLLAGASPETTAQVEATATVLAAAGAEVREVDLSGLLEPFADLSATIMAVEAAAYHREQFARCGHLYGPVIAGLVERGSAVPAHAYVEAQRARVLATRALENAVAAAGTDLLLLPTAPAAAPADLTTTGDPSLLVPWTTAGLPAVSVPIGRTADGQPLGGQLVAGRWRDDDLLAWAQWVESVLGAAPHPSQWT